MQQLVINKQSREVILNGAPLKLPDLSFDLLVCLHEAAPEPVSPEQLAEKVWRRSFVSSHTIAQRVNMVRKALDDDMARQTFIRTVRGRGYAFVEQPQATTAIATNETESPLVLATTSQHKRYFRFIFTATIVVGFLAGFWLVNQQHVDSEAPLLIDPNNGAVRISSALKQAPGYPVFADINERSVIIANTPDLSAIIHSKVAMDILCQIKQQPSLVNSAIPASLDQLLQSDDMKAYCMEKPEELSEN